jgi:type IV fimbrial biogenesis protein FimT
VFLEPAKKARRRHRSSRGFTLIELMVVVIIVAITAVLATPMFIEQMRERRSRETAQSISLLYANARMRAMGRGNAVLVRYNKDTGFKVVESSEGKDAISRSYNKCAAAPGYGCLSASWGDSDGERAVTEYHTPADTKVIAMNPAGAAKDDFAVCFSPQGRTFASYDGTTPTASMDGSVTFSVKRGTTGFQRTVTLLPNGNSRLAL